MLLSVLKCIDFLPSSHVDIKVIKYIFKGRNSDIFSLAALLTRGQLFKERICSDGSKFFPLGVEKCSETLLLKGIHTKLLKPSPFKIMAAEPAGESMHLKMTTRKENNSYCIVLIFLKLCKELCKYNIIRYMLLVCFIC